METIKITSMPKNHRAEQVHGLMNEYYSSIHQCMNAYSVSMNIIHSSTLGLFTDSFVKIYWLFIHPVLGLFIYSRLAAMLIHCQAERESINQLVCNLLQASFR